MPYEDPEISYAQRRALYFMSGKDPYWLDKEGITKEEAGQAFARFRGRKIVSKEVSHEQAWKELRHSTDVEMEQQRRARMTQAERDKEDAGAEAFWRIQHPHVFTRADWDRVDEKDRSAVLHEQGQDIPKPGQVCDSSLLSLCNELKAAIPDEIAANKMYSGHSNNFRQQGLPIFAEAMGHIARDEGEHRAILEVIIEVISQKCGCKPNPCGRR